MTRTDKAGVLLMGALFIAGAFLAHRADTLLGERDREIVALREIIAKQDQELSASQMHERNKAKHKPLQIAPKLGDVTTNDLIFGRGDLGGPEVELLNKNMWDSKRTADSNKCWITDSTDPRGYSIGECAPLAFKGLLHSGDTPVFFEGDRPPNFAESSGVTLIHENSRTWLCTPTACVEIPARVIR